MQPLLYAKKPNLKFLISFRKTLVYDFLSTVDSSTRVSFTKSYIISKRL